jgi:DNA (cytosine-5)-methyltransferase 1
MEELKVIDFFSGCGGLSLGFQNAGFDVLAAFDYWEPALNVYRKNLPDHPAIEVDLSKFDGDVSLFASYNPDMIIGGAPCQDFSSAGKRDESNGRADLTIIFAKIITTVSPKWFVSENVERAIGSKAYAKAKAILKTFGYALTERVLDASLCGVPQARKRLFLIGELDGIENGVGFYLDKNLSAKQMTLRDYFGDSLGVEHYYRHPRSYQRRGIFSIDEPSPTVRGVNRPIPPNYKPHSGDTSEVNENIRPLTTKERSMIQTFPKEFIFEGTKADLEQMIGNAVPVKLAEYVGNCIAEYISLGAVSKNIKSLEKPEQLSFAFG